MKKPLVISDIFIEIVAGYAALVFGFIGYIFRSFGSNSAELRSYPAFYWIWGSSAIICLISYYYLSEEKIIKLGFIELFVANIVVLIFPFCRLVMGKLS